MSYPGRVDTARKENEVVLRRDFRGFAARCFCELNPSTPFLFGWHVELLAAKGQVRSLLDK
jgi:hypothetical protein